MPGDSRGSPADWTTETFPMKRRISRWSWFLLTPVVFVLDGWSKAWAGSLFGGVRTLAPDWLAIRVVRNAGGFLGLWGNAGQPSGWLPPVIMAAAMLVLIGLAVRGGPTKPMRDCAFACMIGGAAGNLYDLLSDGFVTDFIEIRYFPIFNVADLALLFGLGLLAGDFARSFAHKKG